MHMSVAQAEPMTLELDAARRFDYDRRAQCRRQTRVDGEGTYLDFAGRYEDGVMELRRSADGALHRMRWENIEQNGFDWCYQRSDDGGETWTALWEIGYSRVL